MANAICERLIGTIRRECLDLLIPISESHLRSILREWMTHYNRARPHSALGPGFPDPPAGTEIRLNGKLCRNLAAGATVRGKPVVGGLHHEYSLAEACAD